MILLSGFGISFLYVFLLKIQEAYFLNVLATKIELQYNPLV